MKVRLVDVDGRFANLALMKISQYHKQKGDDVAWHNPMFDKNIDLVYASKLFNFTPDYEYFPAKAEIIKGGTGYDTKTILPKEIEQCQPNYSIYPECDFTVQFFSRGCINQCPFCKVPEKEGLIYPVKPMGLNPNGVFVKVLDNNFFSNSEWENAINWLVENRQPVDLQGVDARIITEKQCEALNKLKHYKQIHIAWDNPKDNLIPQLKMLTSIVKPYKLMCYVLIGYWSTPEEDLYRVEKLRELKIDPFVMPFNKSDEYQKKFARWGNHKAIFKTVKWQDYKG